MEHEHIYILTKEMPGHQPGDIVHRSTPQNLYVFATEPHYPLSQEQVESHPDFFERRVLNWGAGETIHFVGLNGVVYSEAFVAAKHATLASFGNAFKTREEAVSANAAVKGVLSGQYHLLLDEENTMDLKYRALNRDFDGVIEIVNQQKNNKETN
jgi:hypothetical protein